MKMPDTEPQPFTSNLGFVSFKLIELHPESRSCPNSSPNKTIRLIYIVLGMYLIIIVLS